MPLERDSSKQKKNNAKLLRLVKLQKAKDAANSLIDFTEYTKPDYKAGWFNELLCLEIDNFIEEVEQGLFPMLMVFAPPRSGKSEICSRRMPAYVFGKHPDWDIIGCSYSAVLAKKMSVDAKRIMENTRYGEIFPNVTINSSSTTAAVSSAKCTDDEWDIINYDGQLLGGSYRAAGVEGGITGQGMNIGIIDDPAKDYKEASSAAYQRSVLDWYDSTFYTRRDPAIHGIIIICTRWHQLDLAGQLLEQAKKGGQQFRVVSFPMEAEKNEEHTLKGITYNVREEGEILFPERMPQAFVDQCKKKGSLTWDALYQQRPTTRGGGVIKTDWFGYYEKLPPLVWRGIYVDTAQKKGEHNDKSVAELWGLGKDGFLYLIDCMHGKMEAWELEINAAAFWKKHKPTDSRLGSPLRYMAVEDKVSGTGLIQNIRKKATCPIVGIPRSGASGNKAARLMDVQGYIQSGFVKLPDPSVDHEHTDCSWVSEFLAESESFTMEMTHAHDDFIDPMIDAINDMMGSGAVISVGSML